MRRNLSGRAVLLSALTAAVIVVLVTLLVSRFIPDKDHRPASASTPTPSETASNAIKIYVTPRPSDTVSIGINGESPGWSLGTDAPIGFDIALAKYLAAKLHLRPRWVKVTSAERESAILDGSVDLVISNYSIDGASVTQPSRLRTDMIDFAGPYFHDRSGITYLAGKLDKGQQSVSEKHICVTAGTTAAGYVHAQSERTLNECMSRLLDPGDDIQGVVTDQTILTAFANNTDASVSPAVRVDGSHPIHQEYYGVGFAKNNPELCTKLTAAINEFLAEKGNSGWDGAFARYLHGQDPEEHRVAHADESHCSAASPAGDGPRLAASGTPR